jgi:molybdopterin converting factor small subunit
MNVNVKCFATLSKEQVCDYHGATPYELSEGATVNELVGKLEIKPEEVKIIFVNHKEVELNHVLNEGDQVALSPKTGGM